MMFLAPSFVERLPKRSNRKQALHKKRDCNRARKQGARRCRLCSIDERPLAVKCAPAKATMQPAKKPMKMLVPPKKCRARNYGRLVVVAPPIRVDDLGFLGTDEQTEALIREKEAEVLRKIRNWLARARENQKPKTLSGLMNTIRPMLAFKVAIEPLPVLAALKRLHILVQPAMVMPITAHICDGKAEAILDALNSEPSASTIGKQVSAKVLNWLQRSKATLPKSYASFMKCLRELCTVKQEVDAEAAVQFLQEHRFLRIGANTRSLYVPAQQRVAGDASRAAICAAAASAAAVGQIDPMLLLPREQLWALQHTALTSAAQVSCAAALYAQVSARLVRKYLLEDWLPSAELYPRPYPQQRHMEPLTYPQ